MTEEIGIVFLILVDQTSHERIRERVVDLGSSGERAGLAAGGIQQRVGARQDDVRPRPRSDVDLELCAVFNPGKSVADDGADIVAQQVGISDHFRAEDLADIVADNLMDFVVETAHRATEIKRLLSVGAGLVLEDNPPKKRILVVAEVIPRLGVELQLVGDRALHANADALIKAALQIRLQCLVHDEWLEAQVIPFRDEAYIDLIAEFRQAAVALIIPEIFVGGLKAQSRLADDQAVGLSADNIAVVENADVAGFASAPGALRKRTSWGAENVAPGLIVTIESAAPEDHRVIANIVAEARDADLKIIREDHVPAANVSIPRDLRADDRLIVETKQIRPIQSESRDAGFVLQRQVNERAGNGDAQALGELRDDRSADREDRDGPGFAILFREVDIVAPQCGGGDARQFEKDGAKFKVRVLRFKAALDQRNGGVDSRQA